MNCPVCGCKESFIIDSRRSNGMVKRRRVCGKCSVRFNTYEIEESIFEEMRKRIIRYEDGKKIVKEFLDL